MKRKHLFCRGRSEKLSRNAWQLNRFFAAEFFNPICSHAQPRRKSSYLLRGELRVPSAILVVFGIVTQFEDSARDDNGRNAGDFENAIF